MADKPLKTVTVDGLSIETTDQGAQVIEKLQRALGDAEARNSKTTADHATAIAAKDAEIAKRDAEIDTLKAKQLSDADLDKRVQQRAELIGKARAIAKDVKTEGLSDAAIRKAAVVAVLGDAAIGGKSDAYVDARFDILVEEAAKSRPDSFRDAVMDGLKSVHTDATSTAHGAYVNHLQDAWKQPAKGAA